MFEVRLLLSWRLKEEVLHFFLVVEGDVHEK